MTPGTLLWIRRLALGLLAAVVVAGAGYVLLRTGPFAPVRVTVVQASTGQLTPSLFGIGTVEARRSFLIGPTTAGRVRLVAVDVGQSVKAGQLLAEMDPVDLDERLAALDAAVLRAGNLVAAAQAQHRDVHARSELAAANTRRYVELGQQHFISAGAVEARQQEQSSADALVAAASANVAAAQQDQQRLVAEQAGLRQQRANLRLLAPADGVVTSREAEPGSTLVAGQAVLRMMDPASLWVKVRLDQARSSGLGVGLPAQVVLRSNPNQPLAGRVARVEAVSDAVTEERIALVSLERTPATLSVGELAEVTLSLPASADAVLLPQAAIKHLRTQTGVWVLNAGQLHFAPVHLGLSSLEGQVQLLSGLEPGATVVVHSEKDLQTHSRVQVVDTLPGRRL